jgi:hypothetical protein
MMLPPATTCHDIPEVSVALFGGVFVSAIVSSFLEWLKSRMSQIFRHSPSFAGSAGIYFLRKCYAHRSTPTNVAGLLRQAAWTPACRSDVFVLACVVAAKAEVPRSGNGRQRWRKSF